MSITKTIEKIAVNGGEEFILARDEKHAESMRVSAFNLRRSMPKELVEDIGIQKVQESGLFFLRIFKRGIDEAQHWVRDKDTGKLIPLPKTETDPEIARIIECMRADNKTEEEIQEYLNSM